MWGRYIHPETDSTSYTQGHLLRRMNDTPASDKSQTSISFPRAKHTTSGVHLQPSVPPPASKSDIIHRISDPSDTRRPFVAKNLDPHISTAPLNPRQYNQLERDTTFKIEPSASSMTDVMPTNLHNAVAMNERNPDFTTTMSQHPPYDTGDSKQNIAMLESETNRLRSERNAERMRADRLAEDLERADHEVHRLNMRLSDLSTENSTLQWTVHSLRKELQLVQARAMDAQRQVPTDQPPHNSYALREGHSGELAEMRARYAQERRHLEHLEEERKTLLDDNRDLQDIVEGLKDAEVDLKRQLKSYRVDNEELRERLAAANKCTRSESMLNRELESKRDHLAQLTRGKREAERALEQLERGVHIGPDFIDAFSMLEAVADRGDHPGSHNRTPKGSSPAGSSGQMTQGSGGPTISIPIPKRPRFE